MDAKKFAEDQQKIIDNFVTGAAGLAQLLQSSAEKLAKELTEEEKKDFKDQLHQADLKGKIEDLGKATEKLNKTIKDRF